MRLREDLKEITWLIKFTKYKVKFFLTNSSMLVCVCSEQANLCLRLSFFNKEKENNDVAFAMTAISEIAWLISNSGT